MLSGAWPILFDVGGINATAFAALTPAVPRVQFGQIRECPHPAGVLPQFNKDGTMQNGGIPQRANLSLHLSTLNNTLQKYIEPDADYWLDVDFESFSLIWELEASHSAAVNASIEHARARHANLTEAQLNETAKGEYESAAMAFWLATLRLIRSVRPDLKLLAYGIPTRFYYDGYDSAQGPLLRAYNDRALTPLVCALDALAPSVYQFYNSEAKPATAAGNRAYVYSNIAEARRIADAAPQACLPYREKPTVPPVIAYIWHRYHDSPYAELSASDFQMFLDEGHRAGADAWAWWGGEGTAAHWLPGETGNFSEMWTERFAPLINAWSPAV